MLLPPYRRGQEGGAQAAPAPAFRDDAVQAQQKTVKLGMTLPLTGTPRYGRSWLRDLDMRRRTQAGLNKGEVRNALARAIFFCQLGELRGLCRNFRVT